MARAAARAEFERQQAAEEAEDERLAAEEAAKVAQAAAEQQQQEQVDPSDSESVTMEDIEAAVDSDDDEFDDPVGPVGDAGEEVDDDDAEFFRANRMQPIDPEAQAKAQAEALAASKDDSELSSKDLKRRLRAERAQHALEKQEQGRKLTKRDEGDLEWFMNRVDIDAFEESGSIVLLKKRRELTPEQFLARRKKELDDKAKRAAIEKRKQQRKRALLAKLLEKRKAREARFDKKQAKQTAEREQQLARANDKLKRCLERERQEAQKKKQAEAKAAAAEALKLAKQQETCDEKLAALKSIKEVKTAKAADMGGGKLLIRLPVVPKKQEPRKETREERMARRLNERKEQVVERLQKPLEDVDMPSHEPQLEFSSSNNIVTVCFPNPSGVGPVIDVSAVVNLKRGVDEASSSADLNAPKRPRSA